MFAMKATMKANACMRFYQNMNSHLDKYYARGWGIAHLTLAIPSLKPTNLM